MDDWQAADYLSVLGLPRDQIERIVTGPPSAQILAAIHRAHVEQVPYETLGFPLARPDTLDADDSVRRILKGRGGYCFILNSALSALLSRLGFTVRLHTGGVQGRGQEPVGANGNHLVLTVHDLPTSQVPEGAWLVDVGLGDALHEPLPLAAGVYQQGPCRYRVQASPIVPDGMRFEHDPSGSFACMDFLLEPTVLDSFIDMHRELSTSPQSGFVQTPTVQRRHAGGFDVLRGCVLQQVTALGTSSTMIDSPSRWFGLLAEVFGLHLRDVAEADRELLWDKARSCHRKWLGAKARSGNV